MGGGLSGLQATPEHVFLTAPAAGVYLHSVGLKCAFVWAGPGLEKLPHFLLMWGQKAHWLWGDLPRQLVEKDVLCCVMESPESGGRSGAAPSTKGLG